MRVVQFRRGRKYLDEPFPTRKGTAFPLSRQIFFHFATQNTLFCTIKHMFCHFSRAAIYPHYFVMPIFSLNIHFTSISHPFHICFSLFFYFIIPFARIFAGRFVFRLLARHRMPVPQSISRHSGIPLSAHPPATMGRGRPRPRKNDQRPTSDFHSLSQRSSKGHPNVAHKSPKCEPHVSQR